MGVSFVLKSHKIVVGFLLRSKPQIKGDKQQILRLNFKVHDSLL